MGSDHPPPSEWVLRQAALKGDERAWNSLYDGAFEPPDMLVLMKRNRIWTLLRGDDENKPIPFTLQANSYRAALMEIAKNHGSLTLVPTGPSNPKKGIGAMRFADDKDEEQRVFAINTGQPITNRDFEAIFKLPPDAGRYRFSIPSGASEVSNRQK
jgi:hypothetical protein